MNNQPPSQRQFSAGNTPVINIQGRSLTIAQAAALASAQQNQGNFPTAAAIYDLVLAQAPDFAEAHNNRGVVMQALRHPEEALASFDRAIAVNPDYANAHNNRANALRDLQRHDEALAGFDRTLALNPE